MIYTNYTSYDIIYCTYIIMLYLSLFSLLLRQSIINVSIILHSLFETIIIIITIHTLFKYYNNLVNFGCTFACNLNQFLLRHFMNTILYYIIIIVITLKYELNLIRLKHFKFKVRRFTGVVPMTHLSV